MYYGIYSGALWNSCRITYSALALYFINMTVCSHLAIKLPPVVGMLVNIAALALLVFLGCDNPSMFNQSTLVLGYLLLYGYDVSGKSYLMRLSGIAVGEVLICIVFYRNHKHRTYNKNVMHLLQEFDLSSTRTK